MNFKRFFPALLTVKPLLVSSLGVLLLFTASAATKALWPMPIKTPTPTVAAQPRLPASTSHYSYYSCSGTSGQEFFLGICFATPASTRYDYTWLDLGFDCSCNPRDYVVFVMPNTTPNGVWTPTIDYHPVGVFFDDSRNKWGIFNEDKAPMPVGAAFNVFARAPHYGVFTHTATLVNSNRNYTDIDDISTNYYPYAYVIVTPNWNPLGSLPGTFDSHPVGVWYHDNHWSIFHEDNTPIPVGASFNVFVSSNADPVMTYLNAQAHVHWSQPYNTSGASTQINCNWTGVRSCGEASHSLIFATLNANPTPYALVAYYNDVLSLWYDPGLPGHYWPHWNLFNESSINMPMMAFNIIVFNLS